MPCCLVRQPAHPFAGRWGRRSCLAVNDDSPGAVPAGRVMSALQALAVVTRLRRAPTGRSTIARLNGPGERGPIGRIRHIPPRPAASSITFVSR